MYNIEYLYQKALEAFYADLPDDAVIPQPRLPSVSSDRSTELANGRSTADTECSASKMAGLAALKRSCTSVAITISDEPSAKYVYIIM